MLAVCGGLMRTGSVAMFQIMREIVDSTYTGYAPIMPLNHEIHFFDKNVKDWSGGEGTVVVKLHRWRDSLEPVKDKIKAVVTIRDLRDVVLSLLHFRQSTFESALHARAVLGNVTGQKEWQEMVPAGNLMIIRYEAFMHNRLQTTLTVAKFLGLDLRPDEAGRIERKWNVTANINRSQKNYPPDSPEFMARRHIYSGRPGKYKEEFTDDQIAQIVERVGKEWFRENGYRL